MAGHRRSECAQRCCKDLSFRDTRGRNLGSTRPGRVGQDDEEEEPVLMREHCLLADLVDVHVESYEFAGQLGMGLLYESRMPVVDIHDACRCTKQVKQLSDHLLPGGKPEVVLLVQLPALQARPRLLQRFLVVCSHGDTWRFPRSRDTPESDGDLKALLPTRQVVVVVEARGS